MSKYGLRAKQLANVRLDIPSDAESGDESSVDLTSDDECSIPETQPDDGFILSTQEEEEQEKEADEIFQVQEKAKKKGKVAKKKVTAASKKRKRDEPTEDNANIVSNSSFRLQAKRMFLTYKGHFSKADYISWLRSKREVKWVRLAQESADQEAPYLHTHVLLEFQTRPNWKDPRCLDYSVDGEMIHPHIKTIKSQKQWSNSRNYLAKEDQENTDLQESPSILTVLSKAGSFQELVEGAVQMDPDNWKSANALKTMWDSASKSHLRNQVQMSWKPHLPWHSFLEQVVEERPDVRTILWIYDRVGNKGKTMMAKFLFSQNPAKWLITKDMGTSRDAATIVSNALLQGWEGWGVIVDLPRQAENARRRIYPILEEIKDGFVTATKYQGGTVTFPHPHLVVFANWPPQVGALSIDRWDIREITATGDVEEVNIIELLQKQKEEKLPRVDLEGQ